MRITFTGYDEMAKLSDLKPSRFQRNIHPPEQIERLALIMREHGVRHPIHVSKLTGEVCFGHGRKAAAQMNGWETYPIVYQDFASEDEEWACVQSDNGIAGWAELDQLGISKDLLERPDFDAALLGIRDFEPLVTDTLEPGCDEDEVPEHVEPKTKLGDIYQLGRHRLLCGDSTSIDAVEKLMNGAKADMVFTDPPYGINYQSNYRKDKFDKLQNDDVVLSEWVGTVEAVCKGWVIFFIGWQRMRDWLDVGEQFGKLTNILVWRKSAAMGDLAGSFSPTYELALAYSRGSKLAGDKRPSAVIEVNIENASEFVHPTQKPISLIETIISAVPSQSILDVFGGSGSTLIACEKSNRKCFMMELDPHYCDVIIARWEKYSGQKAERLTEGQDVQTTA